METSRFRADQLKPYTLGYIAQAVVEARSSGVDIIDLSQVNPDIVPPASAIDRLVQATLLPHNHRYSASPGIARLRQAARDYYLRRYGVELSSSEVTATGGTKEGLAHLLLATTRPEQAVMVPAPGYPVHHAAVTLAGCGLYTVPLFEQAEAEDSGLCLSASSEGFFKRLELSYEKSWPHPSHMIINFPHNPTGACVTLDFFERLVDFAKRHQTFLVHDFAYGGVCFDHYRAPSILQIPDAKDLAVEFISLSKGFGAPGWRLGFCVGNEDLIGALKRVKSYLDFGVFQPLQIAAIELLESAQQQLEEASLVYQGRRDSLVTELRSLGWSVVSPAASLFIWAKIPPTFLREGSLAYCKAMLETAQVAALPGEGFDPLARDRVRFALNENEARIKRAGEQLKRVS